MMIESWPYPPAPAPAFAGPPSFQPERPAAMVAVLVREGGAQRLAATLGALAQSREAGGIRSPHGPVAVLVLTADPAAFPIGEDEEEEEALDDPFPIRIGFGTADAPRAAQRARPPGAPPAPLPSGPPPRLY